jgi:hypothetical protein
LRALCALVLLCGLTHFSAAVAAPRTLVFYYANETSDAVARSENYRALFPLLDQVDTPAARDLTRTLRMDIEEFPAAVAAEVAALLSAAKRLRVDLVAFTNASALKREYLAYDAASDSVEVRPFTPAPMPAGSFATSPLSHVDNFRAALREAGSRYRGSDVLLIANSHGTDDLALMPRVSVDVLGHEREFVALMRAASEPAAAPDWAARRGTTKAHLFAALREVERDGALQFRLVFLAACESGPSRWAHYWNLPRGLAFVAHTGSRNFALTDIDYAAVFRGVTPSDDVIEQVAARLKSAVIDVDRSGSFALRLLRANFWTVAPYLCFVPLILWLAWLSQRALRARRTQAAIEPSR